ncbi:MAG: CRTAC1 family protein [Chitinophagales bacterium]|nr:CRTAC1 family protein [Chitinophagales bacterium]
MKKRTLLIVLVLVLIALGSSAFLMRKKITKVFTAGKSKSPYANIKIESSTMPAIYTELIDKSNPFTLYGRNDEILPLVQKMSDKDPENLQLKFSLGLQNIYFGTTQKGIDILESLEKDPKFMNNEAYTKPNDKGWSKVDSLESFIAVGYLRLGEQQNCINNHNDQSCIFPISGTGIHTNKLPAEEAINRYVKIVQSKPKDYLSIWLLNVACQANGSVPSNVPSQYIIPAARYRNEWNCPKFNEIAMDLGIENTGWAGGVCCDDFDNDGYIDIISSSTGLRDNVKYFHNNGNGTFSDWTDKAGLRGECEGLDIVHADYNNDGWMDFIIPRGGWKYEAGHLPPSLMKNNGNGTFTDVTVQAGLMDYNPSQVAEWADVDHDGDLDLFLGHEMGYPSRLYVNNGNGTFTDISKQSGLDLTSYVKGANWGDYNNDGFPDLYVSCFQHPSHLYKNDGIDSKGMAHFTDVTEKAGVPSHSSSFPCWWFDYNNDGWQDLYVSAYQPGYTINSCREYMGLPMDSTLFPCLYKNNGNGTFTNVDKESHIDYETFTMGCNFGDLDNDGYLDFYLGIGAPDYKAIFPKRMFHNHEGKYFEDCSFSGGFSQLQKGHAIAFCDFDFDGDQDVYADYGAFYYGDVYENALYENPGFNNNWINVKFDGVKTNKYGVGNRVKLTFNDGGKERSTYFIISKGASFGGNPIRLQAGVGKASVIDEMEITWEATGEKQVIKNIPVNKVYLCKEGATDLSEVAVHSMQFQTMERKMAAGDTSGMNKMHHMNM